MAAESSVPPTAGLVPGPRAATHGMHPLPPTMSLEIDTPGQLLRAFEHRAKKRFGQHFLIDPRILNQIADGAGVTAGDRVFEIGPGCGTLTLTMLQRGARVVAAEIDRDAIAFLGEALVPRWPLAIVEGDVLRQDLRALLGADDAGDGDGAGTGEKWKVVANLPYNVATEIFFRLAEVRDRWQIMALMFQKEVAKRLVANVGDANYGVLSLMCRLYCDAEIIMTLPPGAFVPPPRVHSAVVRFEPLEHTRIPDDALRESFERVVKSAFTMRRKALPNALKGLGLEKEALLAALDACGFKATTRPEELSFDDFVRLTEALFHA